MENSTDNTPSHAMDASSTTSTVRGAMLDGPVDNCSPNQLRRFLACRGLSFRGVSISEMKKRCKQIIEDPARWSFPIRDPDAEEEPFSYNGRWPAGVLKPEVHEPYYSLEEGMAHLPKLKESQLFAGFETQASILHGFALFETGFVYPPQVCVWGKGPDKLVGVFGQVRQTMRSGRYDVLLWFGGRLKAPHYRFCTCPAG